MTTSNVSIGSRFEREFCELLASKGFWVHRLAQNKVGQQPADVLAVYYGTAYLIDCKWCATTDRFVFSRMESNQRMAMEKWLSCRGTMPKFALKDSKGQIWMLDYRWAVGAEAMGVKSIACEANGTAIVPFEKWLKWLP